MVKHGLFWKPHKAWEFQTEKWEEWTNYFNFDISLTRKCDHAGFRFNVEICGYFAEFQIYDTRHWNHEKQCWCVYGEDGYEVKDGE
jgi:hypothetical protein